MDEVIKIIITSLLVLNPCFVMGFGILGVIPHKKHLLFFLTSSLIILLESIVVCLAYYVIYNYVLAVLGALELIPFVMMIVVLLVDFGGMMLCKAISKDVYFHYEKNFMFVVHAIILLGLAFISDITLPMEYYSFSIGMQFIGLFIVSLIFFAFNSRINNRTIKEQTRGIGPQFVLMAVLARVGYLILGLV